MFGPDLDTIIHHVENAETLSIYFPMLRRSLVVDMRESAGQGPMVRVMPLARSASDRIRSLKRLRPHLPRPAGVVAIPWATYVENLVAHGIWGRLIERLETAGHQSAATSANACLQDLLRFERQHVAALIRGEQYETIWARKR